MAEQAGQVTGASPPRDAEVLYSTGDHIATITLNRPEKRNSFDSAHLRTLAEAARQLGDWRDLRAVVLRATGPVFSAGADIREMAALDANRARAFITSIHETCDSMRTLPVPAIACIQGPVFGAGLELVASCDIRLAADTARFGMPEVRVGIPSVVEAALLPQLIGWGRTRWLLLTGDSIDAAQALAWGLVDQAGPATELDGLVEQTVVSILHAGPQAVRLQKRLIAEWEELSLRSAIARGIDCFAEAWQTEEPRQMLRAAADRISRRA